MRKFVIIVTAVVFTALLVGNPSEISAAPAPWGIAINENTEECAAYWGGDEFNAYALPEDWTDYYPDFTEDQPTIETPVGTCNWYEDTEEECCEEIGYKYVSDNIGEGGTISDTPDNYNYDNVPTFALIFMTVCCGTMVFVTAGIIIFGLNKYKKEFRK